MWINNASNSEKIIDLVKQGARYLESCAVPEARTEADLLLAHVRRISRDKLYLDFNQEVPSGEKAQYLELLQRRGGRVPLAYLLETREFMGLNFYVNEHVLIPRPETELLVEKTLEKGKIKYKGKAARLLDLCTGSGALAVAIARFWPATRITAVDISEEALQVARKNAWQQAVNIDFRRGDLFDPVRNEKFDIIVSNPPYLSAAEYDQCSPEVKHEPAPALLGGTDGLDFYRKIAEEAGNFLLPGGILLLEIGCKQAAPVSRLLTSQGYQTAVFTDYAGLDRIVTAEKE